MPRTSRIPLDTMPELPEVEVTRRGLAPHLAGRVHLGCRSARAAPALAGAEGGALASPAAPCARVQRRGKYLLVDCGDGHLILHLGMSGSLRVHPAGHAGGEARPLRPRARRSGSAAARSAPLRRGAVDRAKRSRRIRCSRDSGIEPLSQRARRRARLLQADARAPHGDQAVPDGRPAHRRRRQHLREREPVPRRHRSAEAGASALRRRMRRGSPRRSRTRCARRSSAGGSTPARFRRRRRQRRLLPATLSGSTTAQASRAGAAARRSSASCRDSARRSSAPLARSD